MTATSVTRTFVLFAIIAMLVASCGRKGDLEVPSSRPVIENPDGTEPEEEAEEDRPFFLDALIK